MSGIRTKPVLIIEIKTCERPLAEIALRMIADAIYRAIPADIPFILKTHVDPKYHEVEEVEKRR
ncbi:hypothetical protein DRO54_06660 [Candidatus Bathyarchaeota archaeon]|nr:MAG: hypothetical protein DRO54_06660 [Candidatus Bathyarchaeota archaeon]